MLISIRFGTCEVRRLKPALINVKLKTPIILSKLTCLDLIKPFETSKMNALNHVLLLGKHFIYTCKLTNVKPAVRAFEHNLNYVQLLESQIELRKECSNSFEKKWQTLSLI